LFSELIPSNNLGFVSKAEEVQIEIAGKDYELHQSPSILNSDRKAGTTGAGMVGSTRCTFSYGYKSSGRSLLVLRSGCHQRQTHYSQMIF
jgi:hypothetical protein